MKVLKKYPTEILELKKAERRREDRTSELKDGKTEITQLTAGKKTIEMNSLIDLLDYN